MAKLKESAPSGAISHLVVDLASLASVKSAAEQFLKTHPKLHLLVDNAGVAFCAHSITADGFEIQIGTNHFGTVLLTELLLPRLLESAPARVVVLSSAAEAAAPAINWEDLGGSKLTTSDIFVYGTSKLYNALYAQSLQARVGGRGVTCFAVHPGTVKTEIMAKVANDCVRMFMSTLVGWTGISAEKGAVSALFCGTAPLGAGGPEPGIKAMYGPNPYTNRGARCGRLRCAALCPCSVR